MAPLGDTCAQGAHRADVPLWLIAHSPFVPPMRPRLQSVHQPHHPSPFLDHSHPGRWTAPRLPVRWPFWQLSPGCVHFLRKTRSASGVLSFGCLRCALCRRPKGQHPKARTPLWGSGPICSAEDAAAPHGAERDGRPVSMNWPTPSEHTSIGHQAVHWSSSAQAWGLRWLSGSCLMPATMASLTTRGCLAA